MRKYHMKDGVKEKYIKVYNVKKKYINIENDIVKTKLSLSNIRHRKESQ